MQMITNTSKGIVYSISIENGYPNRLTRYYTAYTAIFTGGTKFFAEILNLLLLKINCQMQNMPRDCCVIT